jgi:hypothetical protein
MVCVCVSPCPHLATIALINRLFMRHVARIPFFCFSGFFDVGGRASIIRPIVSIV